MLLHYLQKILRDVNTKLLLTLQRDVELHSFLWHIFPYFTLSSGWLEYEAFYTICQDLDPRGNLSCEKHGVKQT